MKYPKWGEWNTLRNEVIMNQTQPEPKSNIFCLTGILAAVLLSIGILTDGNAHTASFMAEPPPPTPVETEVEASPPQSVEVHHKKASKESGEPGPRFAKLGDIENTANDDQPKKKKMGLALLFLGILAEQG